MVAAVVLVGLLVQSAFQWVVGKHRDSRLLAASAAAGSALVAEAAQSTNCPNDLDGWSEAPIWRFHHSHG
jgi:hypothetical protein